MLSPELTRNLHQKMCETAVVFMGEFVRISEDGADGKNSNTYCDWSGIETIRTCGSEE